jgi:hypothetical protein
MQVVYFLHAEHWEVPGMVRRVFANRQAADGAALELARIMVKDAGLQPMEHATWEWEIARIYNHRDKARDFYVEISAIALEGEFA